MATPNQSDYQTIDVPSSPPVSPAPRRKTFLQYAGLVAATALITCLSVVGVSSLTGHTFMERTPMVDMGPGQMVPGDPAYMRPVLAEKSYADAVDSRKYSYKLEWTGVSTLPGKKYLAKGYCPEGKTARFCRCSDVASHIFGHMTCAKMTKAHTFRHGYYKAGPYKADGCTCIFDGKMVCLTGKATMLMGCK